jgi:thioesterase domain-containing protein/acyl carrier protein
MVPSAFVFLDALPLTPNGKVDRKALPALDRSLSHEREFVAPRTPLEQQLAAIWIRVLGIERIGIHDDFFELGGHSLMAVSLFSEIEKKLGKNLPLATLFQAPTIGQLAGIIQQEVWSAPWSPLVAIQPHGTHEPFFCIHGADGPVLFYNKLALLLGDGQPVYGLQAQGLDGGKIQHSSMEAMAALYIKEIRTVQSRGPYFLGGYSFGGLLALEMAQQLRAQGEKIALVAMFDANNCMVPPRRYTLRERITLRSRVIAGMSLTRKFAYIFDRGIRKLAVIILVQKDRLHRIAYKLFSKRKEVVAPSYRALHVREANDQAMRDYRPYLYHGKLTLIRAENPNDGFEFDSKLGWGGLATEGIEIHDVPGEHETMFQEPHVQILAATMRDCIEEARNAPAFK